MLTSRLSMPLGSLVNSGPIFRTGLGRQAERCGLNRPKSPTDSAQPPMGGGRVGSGRPRPCPPSPHTRASRSPDPSARGCPPRRAGGGTHTHTAPSRRAARQSGGANGRVPERRPVVEPDKLQQKVTKQNVVFAYHPSASLCLAKSNEIVVCWNKLELNFDLDFFPALGHF